MEVLPGQDWGQGSWLVTLGHSVLLVGLTHRRPLTSSRVCDAPRAGTQGRQAPVAPGTCRVLAVVGVRCLAPPLWALFRWPALIFYPKLGVLLAQGAPGEGRDPTPREM